MNTLKHLVKESARAIALVLVFPAACLAAFGRSHRGFVFASQALALMPGDLGSYLRVAYYSLTLEKCGRDSYIAIGSYFSHPLASVGKGVGIGAYCVLGQVNLGDRTMVGSGVQILSGVNQHVRNAEGRLTDEGRSFERVVVGSDCWIGAASVITANLGDSVSVGPATVVSRNVPQGATVVGNPARMVRPPTPDISHTS